MYNIIMNTAEIILLILAIFCIVGIIICVWLKVVDHKRFIKETGGWEKIEENGWTGSPEEFENFYNNHRNKRYSGIYIHKNLNNGKCYVGQSRNILRRVHDEIVGNATNTGCRELYQAYCEGDDFRITIVFRQKGFPSLSAMERHYIKSHGAKIDGYNKTHGKDEETGRELYD